MKLINIGFGNMVSANRLIAIVSPESAPIKRIIQDSRDRGTLIDATYGRRTRAVLITDSDHIILSAVQPETVANRSSPSKTSRAFERNVSSPVVAKRSTSAVKITPPEIAQSSIAVPYPHSFGKSCETSTCVGRCSSSRPGSKLSIKS